MHPAAQRSDLRAGFVGAAQQLLCAQRSFLGAVFVLDAMAAARLAQVFAEQLSSLRMQQPDVQAIPLHWNTPADPARRRAVIGRFDLHATIQMDRAFAVLVIAERLQWQRLQSRPLLGKHDRDLPLSGAVNTSVGPTLFPIVQVVLSLLQTFEALALQRCFLRVADAGLDLPFAIRMRDAAG